VLRNERGPLEVERTAVLDMTALLVGRVTPTKLTFRQVERLQTQRRPLKPVAP
jgi:hypothetical protein